MKLSQLAKALQDRFEVEIQAAPSDQDPEVKSLHVDSRRIRPGDLFLALSGTQTDGRRFVGSALEKGAVAILSDQALEEATPVPTWVHPEARRLASALVTLLHSEALEACPIHAVTGTKGKTTTTRMLQAMLVGAGVPTTSVGTLGWRTSRGEGEPLANTTPEATRLAEILEAAKASGEEAIALEASSQAGVLDRIRHLPLATMAFLNLSPEHGELHPTLEEYAAAKAKLFSDAVLASAEVLVVLPAEGLHVETMRKAVGSLARIRTFGTHPEADVRGEVLEAGLESLCFRASVQDQSETFTLRFGGRFNLENALAALAIATGHGHSLAALKPGLEALEPVHGRFQVLEHGGQRALVDYAHSSESLELLLSNCRELVGTGRLLVVFGCGGKKDPTKRPRMGKSAVTYADRVFVTNDNPRGEDPEAIAQGILAGMSPSEKTKVSVELDRAQAIRRALEEAGEGDLVVVAGKGHETVQDLGHAVIPFDDRAVIRSVWEGSP